MQGYGSAAYQPLPIPITNIEVIVSLHRIILFLLVTLSTFVISPLSHAAQDKSKTTYLGLDVTSATLDIGNASYSPMTMQARLGVTILPEMTPTISLESHVGFSVADDTQTISGNDVTLKLATYLGLYVRGDFNLGQSASLYLLLGAASAQLSGPFGTAAGLPNDDTESGYSYGVGASYRLPWDMKLYLEYTNFVDGDSFSVSGVGLGVTRSID